MSFGTYLKSSTNFASIKSYFRRNRPKQVKFTLSLLQLSWNLNKSLSHFTKALKKPIIFRTTYTNLKAHVRNLEQGQCQQCHMTNSVYNEATEKKSIVSGLWFAIHRPTFYMTLLVCTVGHVNKKLGPELRSVLKIIKLLLLLCVMHIMYLQYAPPSSRSTEICKIDHNIKTHIINYINFSNGTNYLFNYKLFAIIYYKNTYNVFLYYL